MTSRTLFTLDLFIQALWNVYTRQILFLVEVPTITLDDAHKYLMSETAGAHMCMHGVAHVVKMYACTMRDFIFVATPLEVCYESSTE